MHKIFNDCENQIFENEVKEKISSLRYGALSAFTSFDIMKCWHKALNKPLHEKVISRFNYDRFNYYAVQAYREYFYINFPSQVSASNISTFEKAKYDDASLYWFFLKEPLFGAFYVKSVLMFRDMLDDKYNAHSEFGSRANESDDDAPSSTDADSASLGEMIWDMNHCKANTADQLKSNADKPTAEQAKSNTDDNADDNTDEQEDIEELAKKLSEFVHLYNTALDKFKRLKG